VKGVLVSETVQNLHDANQEHPEVKSLPFAAQIEKANSSHQALKDFITDFKKVGVPCIVSEHATKSEELVGTFQEAAKQLSEYQDHIKEIASRASKEASKAKKNWRNDRDYIKTTLEKKIVPSAVARSAATTVQTSLMEPSSIGIQQTTYELQFSAEGAGEKLQEVLAQPALISGAEDKSYLHGAIAKFIAQDRPGIDKKIDKLISQLLAKDGTHAVATEPHTEAMSWNPAGQNIFDIASGDPVRHIIAVLEVSRFDLNIEAMPFLGMGMVITGLQGIVFCAVADPTMVQNGGGDFGVWLKAADSNVLDQTPATLLKPGESMYVPFGHAPLLLALNKPEEYDQKRKQARSKKAPEDGPKHAAIHIALLPDKNDAKAKPGITKRFLTDFMRAKDSWPASVVKSGGCFDAWKSNLERA